MIIGFSDRAVKDQNTLSKGGRGKRTIPLILQWQFRENGEVLYISLNLRHYQ